MNTGKKIRFTKRENDIIEEEYALRKGLTHEQHARNIQYRLRDNGYERSIYTIIEHTMLMRKRQKDEESRRLRQGVETE